MSGHTGDVTVIGGGIAGLTAAIATAERGVRVELFEAHRRLGGRGRGLRSAYVAHEGPHVFYADGPHYRWLEERGLVRGLGWPGPLAATRMGFRRDGRIHRTPPITMLRAQMSSRLRAPVDVDFGTWAGERWGAGRAAGMANLVAVTTYDADTARLSAAFVWDLFQRVYGPNVPGVRWVRGGWQRVIDRMEQRARDLGVVIHLDSRVSEVAEHGPTIVATELASARNLLGDDSLAWESGSAVLLDVALATRRRDRALLFDLDEGGLHESYSIQDDSVAPRGESLFQLQLPVRAGEARSDAQHRLAGFAELAMPGWRDRATWTRTATAHERGGAIDLPGRTWRDRPAVDRGDGVLLAGDMVAAPGMRGEVAINSAIAAATKAVELVGAAA